MAYDMNSDYVYICNSLAAIIASVGGDETAVNSITLDELKGLITVAHSGIGSNDNPSSWTASQRTVCRSRQRKFDNARKFIYQRDLIKARNG